MEISEINPDGNVYQLKDATARTEIAQIKAQNAYSTEEVNTGKKWIDGKPIYRIVKTKTLSISAGQTYVWGSDSIIPNVDRVIKIVPIQLLSNGGMRTSDGDWSAWTYYKTGTNIGITVYSAIAVTNMTCNLILEYTKTTD